MFHLIAYLNNSRGFLHERPDLVPSETKSVSNVVSIGTVNTGCNTNV